MKAGRILLSAIPYGFVAIFALWQSRMPPAGYFNNMMLHAPRSPNPATGEVWEIALKSGGNGYITQSDYLLVQTPLVVIPIFMIAILWIMHDWYKAGIFEMFSSK
jgi:hypothetical protein